MSNPEDRTGMHLNFGTYEDAKKFIGMKGEVQFSEVEVNWPMIKLFCGLVEDANPSFWSPEYARKQWGGIIAPPAMIQVWGIPLQWHPEGVKTSERQYLKAPLPGDKVINVSSEIEYFRPVVVGEQLNSYDEFVSISEEKKTALGVGHFITAALIYRNQAGEVVARATNTMYRYKAKEGALRGNR